MPHEIADSDAESDFNSPTKQPVAPKNVVGDAAPSQASLSGYDFDQFLNSTQRLSSFSPTQQNPDMRLRSSGSHLDGTSDAVNATAARPKKRPHSALHESSNDLQESSGLKEPGSRKAKVYGHPSRSRTVHDVQLFTSAAESSSELCNTEPTVPAQNVLDQPLSDLAQETSVTNASLSPNLTLPSGILSLIGQSPTDGSHRLTTSVASMGQYECLNLDFRGSGQGLDINTNPFGSLSQVSLDEDPNPAETERLASVFLLTENQLHVDHMNQSTISPNSVLHDNQTPNLPQVDPDAALTANPSRLLQDDGDTFYAVSDGRNPELEVTMGAPDIPDHSDVATADSERPQPKKRGRKPKNPRMASKSPAPRVLEDIDELALPHLLPQNRSRRGTLDSLSQASQTSATTAPSKKRKRGKSTEVVEDEQQGQQTTESSPTKQIASEPNLSDESLIGLPKEQYKPRPSRSRSKRVVDDEDAFMTPPVPGTAHDTPAKTTSADAMQGKEQSSMITTTKSSAKKSGRKSKVKRAKTSAAALLKRGDPMLSEGEDDVVWMDTKPAPVKLDLPPDLKVLKKEADVPKDDEEETKQDDHADTTSAREGNGRITIEIPIATEVKDPATGPKKRGRKPKKAQQREGVETIEESHDTLKPRPALAEISPNTPDTNMSGRELKAPTVSPISVYDLPPPVSPEKPNGPTASALTTPHKQAAETGPTKHSPINALNLSSGRKVTYRVGLSRRQHIPSLLRKVQRDKPLPKVVVRKEPKGKKDVNIDNDCDGDGEGRSGLAGDELRGADGMLIEWGD
ncbi:hypothetical protein A1O3_04811 [Capronia epimyces CBS 606.96]|uniref:Uncharacterized protein n=1 Tax=Capronia epimyces CBS 606.96 TaxID=1182542 RepID=W9YPF1_9EURO|nr:uncharacterized protein A1O3_04811 [Capronia epimyces CBS 606.96]EXJ84144.1 hypothetical protein A1O3_04811 [Capronia epimyces CBS 606.96]